MRVRLFCNDHETFVSPFIEKFTANVCRAVTESLKAPSSSRSIQFILQGDGVGLHVDGKQVLLDSSQGFAETIVRDTLKGMVRHLKAIDPEGVIRIEIDLEEKLGQT
jgi:hypothetical protein